MITSGLVLSLSTAHFLILEPQRDLTNLIFTTNDLKISITLQNPETMVCHIIHVFNTANHKDCQWNDTELSIKYLSER